MTTPTVGAPEWAAQQASPWTPANKARRIFDAFTYQTSVADRNLLAPPGSCADGARYLIDGVGTGAWLGHNGELAIAFGANASNGWIFAVIARNGVRLWVEDEAVMIEYVGGVWQLTGDSITSLNQLSDVDLTGINDGDILVYDLSNGQFYPAARDGNSLASLDDVDLNGIADGYVLRYDASNNVFYFAPEDIGAAPFTFSGTTHTSALAEAGGWLEFTNAAAVAWTIPPNSTTPFEIGTFIQARQAGAGTVTITAGAGVTLQSRAGALASAGQYAIFGVKKVGADTWAVIGDVA